MSDFKTCRVKAVRVGVGFATGINECCRDFATTIWNLEPAVYGDASLFTPLFDLLDHAIQIGIARTKASCEPVPAALCNFLAVSDNLELTSLPRCNDGFSVEALLDEGHETRDLGLVVLSGRAVNNLDLHLPSKRFPTFYAVRFAFSMTVEIRLAEVILGATH